MSKLLSVLIASILAASMSLTVAAADATKADVKVEKAEAAAMKKDAKADYALAEKNAKAAYKAASVDCKKKPSAEQKTCLSDAKAARDKAIVDAKATMVKATAESKAAKKAAAAETDASKQKAGTKVDATKGKAKEPVVAVNAVPAPAAVDETAALALAKSSKCMACHAVDKEKKGPSFKKVAAEFKGKPDGESKVTRQITAGAQFKDGSGDHPMVDTKDTRQIKNLVSWILSR